MKKIRKAFAIVCLLAACTAPTSPDVTVRYAWATSTAEAVANQRSEVALVVPWDTGVTAVITELRITTTEPAHVELFDGLVLGFDRTDDSGYIEEVGLPIVHVGAATHDASIVDRMFFTVRLNDELLIRSGALLTLYDRKNEECVIIRPTRDGVGITVSFVWREELQS